MIVCAGVWPAPVLKVVCASKNKFYAKHSLQGTSPLLFSNRLLDIIYIYGTARFKLQERTRLQLHAHDTSTEILVTC